MAETNDDYTKYRNIPKINGIQVIGNLSLSDLGIEEKEEITSEELQNMWND